MSANSTNLATKPHYPILDGLRGVAAITVVAYHILEASTTNTLTQAINHGYLAVDFFFVLSGFVIGYAYDDRWHKMTIGGFFKRRLERLQPMVIMGMLIGALCFYFSDSPAWPNIHNVPVWQLLLVMLVGFTLLPIPPSMDIRGWQEMHPLNGPGWSLFYEYVANILYALGLRKLNKPALWLLVMVAGAWLAYYVITSPGGDVIGGWALDPVQLKIGFTRLIYPFFAGLLLSRSIKPGKLNKAFLWCSILLLALLCVPRLGGQEQRWMNGIYEAAAIIIFFPLVVYLGACGEVKGKAESKICKFLGDISYPIYITHFPFIYIYAGWASGHRPLDLKEATVYGIITFTVSVIVAYATLVFYDEPVRAWLRKKLN
ncbi:acyltransferase family protein [Mucilaginibacter pedocola]|uniref:Acyltransferase n=1 Tax=Mucilaginibacter pedocola TaxID=1792845 RepID=A0A1S9PBZ8_9SPHI|nr:acyltransferase [Mucilaginibacter pedocola]OOQ58502.1 acyltransferase [Mucilaginibacter pedocola]